MVANALGTLGAIVLATLLFTVPLVLKYHVLKPHTKHVATGDVIQVHERISTTWCQAVDLSTDSSATFQSFLYDTEPTVNENDVSRIVVNHRITLPNRSQRYWGFRLLRGSNVSIASCVRLYGGDLTVVRGYKALRRCLAEHRYALEGEEEAEEDSLSESESEDVTSSISSSQGAVSNETYRMYRCSDSLYHVALPSTYVCHTDSSHVRKPVLHHPVEHTDQYYYLFSSDTYLDILPNEFSVEFVFDRTHYDYTTSSGNCSSAGQHCLVNLTLASEEKIVVQMDGANGTLSVEELEIACRPREWLFCIFYFGFFVVIFLCAFQ